jgi:hypothetical protein
MDSLFHEFFNAGISDMIEIPIGSAMQRRKINELEKNMNIHDIFFSKSKDKITKLISGMEVSVEFISTVLFNILATPGEHCFFCSFLRRK